MRVGNVRLSASLKMNPLVPVRVCRIPASVARRTRNRTSETHRSGSPPVMDSALTPSSAAWSTMRAASGRSMRVRGIPLIARIEHCGHVALQQSVSWSTT